MSDRLGDEGDVKVNVRFDSTVDMLIGGECGPNIFWL
jgi:hypothetical protein